MAGKTEIADWYRGKAVFITGATGFMGKMLMEKLLRSCPDVGPIYVLVREKKHVLPRDRVEKMMSSGAFDGIRATRTDWENLVVPITGDIGQPELGMSGEDRKLLQATVSVVFHVAATVRFDEPLRVAVAINVEGTRALMQLCLGMAQLQAVVHVSTAYANCNLSKTEERVYAPPADVDKVLHCVAGMDDELLEIITPRLIGDRPNSYTFTKALAEHVVAGYSSQLPIVIVRPSIVTSSWREPTPGLVDNFYGPAGFVAAASKGLLRSLFGKDWLIIDLIPVDVCINLFIAAAWEIGTRDTPKLVPNVLVYNCVSGPCRPLLWKDMVRICNTYFEEYPMSDTVMSAHTEMTFSRVKHDLTQIIDTLRIHLADGYLWLSGGSPRLRNYQRHVNKMANLMEYFRIHEFEFIADNAEKLKHRLNSTDKLIFNFDISNIDWNEYITAYCLGISHLMNEKLRF